MKRLNRVAGLVALAAGSLAASTNFSFTGTFSTDDQVQLFDLTLTSTTLVTFETWSYGGGTNSAGTVIPAGGFDPLLTLFYGDGDQLEPFTSGSCPVPQNLYLEACNDVYAQESLGAGSYILALTQYGNDSEGDLSDGFSETGNPTFTADPPCPQFCDLLSGDQLSGNWAVDILTVTSASAVPEPVSMALTWCGLAILGVMARKRSAKIRRKRT
jgi:hypothetical protein